MEKNNVNIQMCIMKYSLHKLYHVLLHYKVEFYTTLVLFKVGLYVLTTI